jgi:hypothetical protein
MQHIFNDKFDTKLQIRILFVLVGILFIWALSMTSVVRTLRSHMIDNGVLGKETQKPASGVLSKKSGTLKEPSVKSSGVAGSSTPTHSGKQSPHPTGADIGNATAGDIAFLSPPCPEEFHKTTMFHTLWDPVRLCHFDHEHGQNPFISDVGSAFPGFDLLNLLGGVGIGHTNLSSPMENTHKHGGFKWQVTLDHPQDCAGFEGAVNGVNASVIQYHGFGDYSVELEGRTHSSAALLRLCNSANPTEMGYMYTVQLQDYGQRVVPYQGTIFPYPDNPTPSYNSGLGPYLTVDCIGNVAQCRTSRDYVLSRRISANTNWSSKPTGSANIAHPFGSKLFTLFFRSRDTYQMYDWNDQTHPFTFIWLCSSDGGRSYDPAGCRYNNSTTQVHEIAGEIPACLG